LQSKKEAQELILSREQYYIDSLNPEYNILKTAGSLLGYKHTEETIALMSLAKSGENNAMFGKSGENHPRGMLGKTHSPETLAKLSAVNGTTVYVYSSDGSTLLNTFPSARKAGEYFNCCHHTIKKYALNGLLFQGKWILSTCLITAPGG